jgi:SAM-dependent methyltransferase
MDAGQDRDACTPLLASPALRLFACGLLTLFWELVLIRWLGASIRVIAYYSNFVLTAAFFGLAAGSLLAARRETRLDRGIFPALALCVSLGSGLAGVLHKNPSWDQEHVWQGAPAGVVLESTPGHVLSLSTVLVLVYLATAGVFFVFGEWMGSLFKRETPIRGYSLEISGSIAGILLFGALSWAGLSPIVWMIVGFLGLVPLIERSRSQYALALLAAGVTIACAAPLSGKFIWSPYYKIHVEPVDRILDHETNTVTRFERPIGYALTVNDDYHQMLLDLTPRASEHPFLASWRALYDAPYAKAASLPPGPILVLGAGTGNDVCAALRCTDRHVDAVEIDPTIIELGREKHFEHPYQNPRVTVVADDARTFLQTTPTKYALVVFGFLDSHTLLSSFASIRLDNFVYTRQSLERVKDRLLPGGRVYLTFASNTPWLDERLARLLDEVFDEPTVKIRPASTYANGIVYGNVRSPDGARRAELPPATVVVPTDDWPFLYLKAPAIPSHYLAFMGLILALALLSLLLLPAGRRRVRMPYFLFGAAFFLIETSNVVSLSLLFGSTWIVNFVVFTGILTLVLLGNLTCVALPRLPGWLVMLVLAASVVLAWAVPASALLGLGSGPARSVVAVILFLGPVYFSAVLFAKLVKEEPNLTQAYGSNVLGAMVGGACEYFSLVLGFKPLLLLTLAFYLVAFALILRDGRLTTSSQLRLP